MRAGAGSVDGTASPVGLVVSRLEPGTRPVRHLVAAEAGRLELHARGVELVPLQVCLDLRHAAFGPAPEQKRALLERQAVGRDVVRTEGDRAPQRVEPRLHVLVRDRVDQVDADVRHAHGARELERARRLRRVRLPLQDRERARVEALDAEAEAVDAALHPGLQPGFVGAGGVRLQRHLGVGGDVELAADEGEQAGGQRRREQARRATAEVDRLQLLERKPLAREDQLALEGVDVVRHQPVHARVRVEIAVAALVLAERDVHVEVPEGVQRPFRHS